VKGQWTRQESEPIPVKHPPDIRTNGSCSGASTPSTISPGENTNLEDELSKVGLQIFCFGNNGHCPVHAVLEIDLFVVFR
jgi:hypothetical protein